MSNRLKPMKWSPWITISRTVNTLRIGWTVELVEPLSRNSHPKMTQNEHVYTICCRSEAASDVISGWKVVTDPGYIVVNFAVASSSGFWDIKKNYFVTAADIDDRIKWKRIRVSLNNVMKCVACIKSLYKWIRRATTVFSRSWNFLAEPRKF